MDQQFVIDRITEYYMQLPFNKVLGIRIDTLEYESGKASTVFDMTPDLIGNYFIGILHGGVISSVIDLTGGLSALISCAKFHEGESLEHITGKLAGTATIDVRVDYLRPGKGDHFSCTSEIIRAGSRIVVAKMDLFNEKKTRIATGTGTYLIGQ
ncbi:MAG: thioesterase family protein [Desulfobacteraceae bacterium]|nr:MAG: thioesterase family protein [Desulfobacteraceae bacterium]